ncbi:MAG: hypothetical protein ACI9OU_001212, partial [Candidatus Promineifilaceae bacterium]
FNGTREEGYFMQKELKLVPFGASFFSSE